MTCPTLTHDIELQNLWRTTVVKHGLSHPFLLHEILALAALHLATDNPEEQDLLVTRATELQNDALGRFHEVAVTDESNCIAVMLFSCLLGVHLLADRSPTQGLGSSAYLDHIFRCIGLLRGVMKLGIRDWTSFFQASDIAPLIQDRKPQVPLYDIPNECRDLTELVKESDLGPSSVAAYNTAIDRLFWLLAVSGAPNVAHNTSQWAIGWPVQLPDEYNVLLNQRQPEALIILSYYGVVLHFYRESWTIGDTGARLVRAVNSQVGSFWELELIGYVGRAIGHADPVSLPPYILQSILILVAPALFAATIYMTLGRIIRATHAEAYSPIRVNWLTKIFVFGDVLSFCTQGAGGGQLAAGDPDKGKQGQNIILGGLFLQIVIFGLFVLVSFIFHQRLRKQPTSESLVNHLRWQKMMGVLYVVSAIILVRNIFRVVEYVGGNDGPLLRVEWPIYVFDALLMAATMAVWGFWYPTVIRPRGTKIGAAEAGVPLPNVDIVGQEYKPGVSAGTS
ncbi:MAG: hypothetical protein Q9197_004359 [Variospora fuerteventurae]